MVFCADVKAVLEVIMKEDGVLDLLSSSSWHVDTNPMLQLHGQEATVDELCSMYPIGSPKSTGLMNTLFDIFPTQEQAEECIKRVVGVEKKLMFVTMRWFAGNFTGPGCPGDPNFEDVPSGHWILVAPDDDEANSTDVWVYDPMHASAMEVDIMKQMQDTAEGHRVKELPEFVIRRETLCDFFERLQTFGITGYDKTHPDAESLTRSMLSRKNDKLKMSYAEPPYLEERAKGENKFFAVVKNYITIRRRGV